MLKKITLFLFAFAIYNNSNAQDASVKDLQNASATKIKSDLKKDGWKKGGLFALNVNQGMLQNWAAGGEANTIGINGILNYTTNYKKGKVSWDNLINLGLGFQNATSYGGSRKMNDIIDLTTTYGIAATKKWNYAILANFNSQFMPGYDYTTLVGPNQYAKISNFLAPGKLLVSPGMEYKPNDEFSLFLSPITVRWIFKNDQSFYPISKFGVAANKKIETEYGAFASAKYNHNFTKNIAFTSRLDLFSNYKHNPANVDVYFTNLLSLKVGKYLSTNISLNMIYDDDVIKATQIQELIGVGFAYNLK